MAGWAEHERGALLEALAELGPDAPTLCEGWSTQHMAAHLYVRERRPDAALGVLPLGPLSAYTDRVMASVLRVHSYDDLLDRLRTPPAYVRALRLDELINVVEFFVHTEDVRRPNPMPVRDLPEPLQRGLAQRLSRQARVLFRRAPVPLRLEPTVGLSVRAGAKDGDVVTVKGLPSEILLFGFNRKDAARVDLDGSAESVERLQQAQLGL
ncbi:MAG TPA: TIGR03085 family metal-binding protein [Mycobacteriales bacterium]|nr:TIGR03085 family metal-binding protein [Mycobacteriales bacterium]